MRLHKTLERASFCDQQYFTGQVNRLLSQLESNYLVIQDDTSMPDFETLMTLIDHQRIGWIEVFQRRDVNAVVGTTLACKIFMEQGVLEVRPHWCSYKPIRAEELFRTLIAPLLKPSLCDKSFLVWSEDEKERLMDMKQDLPSLVRDVLSFSLIPSRDYSDDFVQKISTFLNVSITEPIKAKDMKQ